MAVLRKTVTVLFCDIADSTPLGERLDPEVLQRVLARYFEAMSGAIERHGGTVTATNAQEGGAIFEITIPDVSSPETDPRSSD